MNDGSKNLKNFTDDDMTSFDDTPFEGKKQGIAGKSLKNKIKPTSTNSVATKKYGQHLIQAHKRGVAVWLFSNTCLSFKQIADFCGIKLEEMLGIANDEVVAPYPIDPISFGLITKENIGRGEADPSLKLLEITTGQFVNNSRMYMDSSQKKTIGVSNQSRRRDKPSAVAWLIENHPYMGDMQIVSLIGTTKNTIVAIRRKTHWNIASIKPKNPVDLGICSKEDLEQITTYARMSHERKELLAQINSEIPQSHQSS